MPNVTLKGLPQGNATLYYTAKVEHCRQGTAPLPTPLSTVAVGDGTTGNYGEATFNLTSGLSYTVFGSDGKGRLCMYGPKVEITSLNPASIVHAVPTTVRVLGTGFTLSSRVRVDGVFRRTTYVSPTELQATLLNMPAAGTFAVVVENAGVFTAPVNLTVT